MLQFILPLYDQHRFLQRINQIYPFTLHNHKIETSFPTFNCRVSHRSFIHMRSQWFSNAKYGSYILFPMSEIVFPLYSISYCPHMYKNSPLLTTLLRMDLIFSIERLIFYISIIFHIPRKICRNALV